MSYQSDEILLDVLYELKEIRKQLEGLSVKLSYPYPPYYKDDFPCKHLEPTCK